MKLLMRNREVADRITTLDTTQDIPCRFGLLGINASATKARGGDYDDDDKM